MNEAPKPHATEFVWPMPAKWEMSFTGDGHFKFVLPCAPSAFHRMMQRVALVVLDEPEES